MEKAAVTTSPDGLEFDGEGYVAASSLVKLLSESDWSQYYRSPRCEAIDGLEYVLEVAGNLKADETLITGDRRKFLHRLLAHYWAKTSRPAVEGTDVISIVANSFAWIDKQQGRPTAPAAEDQLALMKKGQIQEKEMDDLSEAFANKTEMTADMQFRTFMGMSAASKEHALAHQKNATANTEYATAHKELVHSTGKIIDANAALVASLQAEVKELNGKLVAVYQQIAEGTAVMPGAKRVRASDEAANPAMISFKSWLQQTGIFPRVDKARKLPMVLDLDETILNNFTLKPRGGAEFGGEVIVMEHHPRSGPQSFELSSVAVEWLKNVARSFDVYILSSADDAIVQFMAQTLNERIKPEMLYGAVSSHGSSIKYPAKMLRVPDELCLIVDDRCDVYPEELRAQVYQAPVYGDRVGQCQIKDAKAAVPQHVKFFSGLGEKFMRIHTDWFEQYDKHADTVLSSMFPTMPFFIQKAAGQKA